ncbi:MAG: sulfite exporter TauE/SafE family protein [Candidatus Magasanikbacteria bacterium]|nr:sulfite exporter TauE/SafE family protein [Candidatus Magasanikbacteria bacterium]
MPSCNINIRGMHCKSCELLIEGEIKKIPGVSKVNVNYKTGVANIAYEEPARSADAGNADQPSLQDKLKQAVEAAGYTMGTSGPLPWISKNYKDYEYLILGAAALWVVYGLAKMLGILNYSVNSGAEAGVGIALIVGLVAGVSTCMALVGGLVLGLSARHAERHPEATRLQKFRPHLYFNAGRILGYTILGGVIGAVGSALKPSPTFLGFFTIIVGLVMLFLGLKLIEIFPKLKNSSLTLPKSLARFFGMSTDIKEYSHQSALYAGAASFFLPCGFTQAMQLYAVSTGSLAKGALIMGLFALGTAPGLLSLGGLSSVFKGAKARVFFAAAGIAVIILGWYNVSNGQLLLFGGFKNANTAQAQETNANSVQEVRMTQTAGGYSPNILTVKAGTKIRWIINSTSQFSCASSVVVPSLGISRSLNAGENIIEFTAPVSGEIPFSCSMGMYRGKIIIK